MLERWRAQVLFPSKETGSGGVLWGRISASVCLLLVLSFVFVCYYAFNSGGGYRWWHCTGCGAPTKVVVALADVPTAAADARTPTNLSHIVFGIGGSVRTWRWRRWYTELWWRPGETRGHVWLDEAPIDTSWPATSPPYRVSADASQFGELATASRMARIVAESQRLHAGNKEVRWFVMGDDDTVFFVDNLVATLGKYDHEEMYYVGAPSESVEQDVIHSYGMAFGGGGFAVSAPAAAELARVMNGCLERYALFYGSDQRVQACLSELGIPLTRELGFHQMDVRGDVYGMLAAHPVAPLVSLHHPDYVAPITPQRNQLGALRKLVGASRFDPARVLQQCFCYEKAYKGFTWSVSVSWGYTVQLYPRVLAAKDLEVPLRTFMTWRTSSDGPFTFNTRPLVPDRPCERPLVYFLDSIREGKQLQDGAGTTVSEYSRYRKEKDDICYLPGYGTALKVETVRVFAPKMDLAAWRRAPRRQCCQTRRTWWGRTLEVRIRNCNKGDVTSPP